MIDIDQAREQARRVSVWTLRELWARGGKSICIHKVTLAHALGYRDALEGYFCDEGAQTLEQRVECVVHLIQDMLDNYHPSKPHVLLSPAGLVVEALRHVNASAEGLLMSELPNLDTECYQQLMNLIDKPSQHHTDKKKTSVEILQEELMREFGITTATANISHQHKELMRIQKHFLDLQKKEMEQQMNDIHIKVDAQKDVYQKMLNQNFNTLLSHPKRKPKF